MGSDDERRRKSRKHDGSGRSKHRSSRDDDRGHRDRGEDRRKDSGRHGEGHRDRDRESRGKDKDSGRHRHRDSRDERKPRGKDNDDRSNRDSKLTEEEERLLAKAREYVEQKGKEKDSRRSSGKKRDRHHGKDRRSESYDSRSDSESDSSRHDRKRSRSRKEHKRSKRDDHHEKSRHKKKSKSKHGHHDEEKNGHKDKKKKHSKSEPSFKDKASSIDASKLFSLGDIMNEPPKEPLDPTDNYFSHNSHLRLYLYRQFGIYFEDLTSPESHHAFEEFAKEFNAGKLEKGYSSGTLPQEALDQCSRTKHKWKFQVNKMEKNKLDVVRAGVKKQTEYNDSNAPTYNIGRMVSSSSSSNAATATGKRVMNPQNRPQNNDQGADDGTRRRKTPEEIASQRRSDKQHRERIKLANEEMHGTSKADAGSWERKLENKRERSSKLHGAAKDRDAGVELDDDAIYGSGGVSGGRRGESSYEEAVAKERSYRERREAKKAARTDELLQKEEEKRRNMLAMLGLSGMKAGEKIKIAPRTDA